jgi:hypothetical protein
MVLLWLHLLLVSVSATVNVGVLTYSTLTNITVNWTITATNTQQQGIFVTFPAFNLPATKASIRLTGSSTDVSFDGALPAINARYPTFVQIIGVDKILFFNEPEINVSFVSRSTTATAYSFTMNYFSGNLSGFGNLLLNL